MISSLAREFLVLPYQIGPGELAPLLYWRKLLVAVIYTGKWEDVTLWLQRKDEHRGDS
jgi:hypothetical protein